MIRHIAYRKAVLAGMAGAIAWEVVARPLILVGAPYFDIVGTLGTLVLPHASPWAWWTAGMALHLSVGAIWAVFYAYFFWSVLPLPPIWQGFFFAFVPMPLALFIMHPQFELMHPLVQSGELPYSGLFGVSGGLHEPASIVAGHLIWGTVLGLVYVRPVGYAAKRRPRHIVEASRSAAAVASARQPAEDRFMFATGIECSYPTLEGGRWRVDEMAACGHYRHWRTDLLLVRDLGLRYLRYGPPLHLINHRRGQYDWAFLDEVAAEMQRLGITPIMDLCHFGLPDWLENFQNPDAPHALADYARAFARRYDWVRFYTPVNEMYVCARLSALEGLWNEQRRDERAFVTATRHLAKASVLMMQAIAAAQPDVVFINSESGEFFQPCCPDPRIRQIADFENQRRFIALDLLYAGGVREDIRDYLIENGMPPEEYAWFMQQDVGQRAILGVDYYEWNEKLIDAQGNPQALGELFGWYVIARQYYERYQRPMMHTETNCLDAREAPRWLWRQWHNVQLMRNSGVPIVGFTWYSLTDQVDWDIALREPLGNVNPVGLFDLNRDPRLVGLAYKHLMALFEPDLRQAPSIGAVLNDALWKTSPPRSRRHA
ncbi:family 1 glycosylhydrolase [Methylocystis sp. JAN1]|uniref:family 1 glycosylhydrolase n=1 Tax=Methylocystis sp. JAN1 TaxID=3397211 RepID=UPI003FA2AAF2